MGLVDHLTEIDERGNYQIELAIDTNGAATPIKDAKNKINEVCKQKSTKFANKKAFMMFPKQNRN